MTSRKRFATAAGLVVLGFGGFRIVRAGSLEPPGPPTPTMQALDEVSPWIPINQTRASAGGITPGDSPGFPVTIGVSGSYRLTGNLTLNNTSDGISVTASDVTIDLNGFTISGPVMCSGTGSSLVCSPSSGWRGILVVDPAARVVIRNGSVRGFGTGVLAGSYSRVEHLAVTSNSGNGIHAGPYSVIDAVQSSGNGSYGIDLDRNVEVTRSTTFENKQFGVLCGDGCIVRENISKLNGANGINVGHYGVVSGNVAENNEGGGIGTGSSTMVSFNSSNLNGAAGGSQISTNGGCIVTGNSLRNKSTSGFALKLLNTSDGFSNNVIFAVGSVGPVQNGTNLGQNLCTPACP
jgi:hypothetical protein